MDFIKLKINRLLYQYDYLETYLQEIKYKYNIYNETFLKEYYEYNPDELKKETKTPDTNTEPNTKPEPNIDTDTDTKQPNVESDIKEILSSDSASMDPIIVKLYKKLSLKLHPDKQGGTNKLFLELQKAFIEKNIIKLIKMAQNVFIDYTFISDDILVEYIEKDIKQIEANIHELQHHVCYLWCTSDEDVKKKFKLP